MEILKVLSRCETYLNQFACIKKECIDEIFKMLDEFGGPVDFNEVPDIAKGDAEDYQFLEEADPCFATFFDHHASCDVVEMVQGVSIDRVEGVYNECAIEDLNAIEAMQLYRCLAEYIHWARTGKLICM